MGHVWENVGTNELILLNMYVSPVSSPQRIKRKKQYMLKLREVQSLNGILPQQVHLRDTELRKICVIVQLVSLDIRVASNN